MGEHPAGGSRFLFEPFQYGGGTQPVPFGAKEFHAAQEQILQGDAVCARSLDLLARHVHRRSGRCPVRHLDDPSFGHVLFFHRFSIHSFTH